MSMNSDAFKPTGLSAALAVTTTSTATPIQVLSSAGEPQSQNYLVSNATSQGVFLAVGGSAVAAVAPTAGSPANGLWLAGNSTQSFTFSPKSYFAAIAPTATSTVYITPGTGS
jgi:hypothetical protein